MCYRIESKPVRKGRKKKEKEKKEDMHKLLMNQK